MSTEDIFVDELISINSGTLGTITAGTIEHADLFGVIRDFEETDVGQRIRRAMDAYERANDAYQRAMRAIQPRVVVRRVRSGSGEAY